MYNLNNKSESEGSSALTRNESSLSDFFNTIIKLQFCFNCAARLQSLMPFQYKK